MNTKSTSLVIENILHDFLPRFYAELLYVAFVVLLVLIVKQDSFPKNKF